MDDNDTEPPGVKKKGPYLKGILTIGGDPGNDIPGGSQIWHSHLFLRWGNRIYLAPFQSGTEGYKLCPEALGGGILLTDESLKQLLIDYPVLCYAQVEERFGLEGTPLVKDIIITDRGGCNTPAPSDDIIRAEIIVSVVPTSTILDEDGVCLLEPPPEP